MQCLIFLDADMSALLHKINNRHNFVAHTIISCSVCCSTQFQATEKLLEVGRKKYGLQPTTKLILLVDVGHDFLPHKTLIRLRGSREGEISLIHGT